MPPAPFTGRGDGIWGLAQSALHPGVRRARGGKGLGSRGREAEATAGVKDRRNSMASDAGDRQHVMSTGIGHKGWSGVVREDEEWE